MAFDSTDAMTPQSGVTAREACVTASEVNVTASEVCVTASEACVTASEAWQSRLYETPTAAPARVDRHAALAMTDWGLAMTCHGRTP